MGREKSFRVLAIAFLLGSCESPQREASAKVESVGSVGYSLGRPTAYVKGEGIEVTGLACRRNQSTLLTPEYVRIENVSAKGEVIRFAKAYLPTISVKVDQPCGRYSIILDWVPTELGVLRVCFDQNKRCPPTG